MRKAVLMSRVIVASVLLPACVPTGNPAVDTAQVALLLGNLAAGTLPGGGPAVTYMKICADESEAECDGGSYPWDSRFTVDLIAKISEHRETGDYDFSARLLLLDKYHNAQVIQLEQAVSVPRDRLDTSARFDLACNGEGALVGLDGMALNEAEADGARHYVLMAQSRSERLRSFPYAVRCSPE